MHRRASRARVALTAVVLLSAAPALLSQSAGSGGSAGSSSGHKAHHAKKHASTTKAAGTDSALAASGTTASTTTAPSKSASAAPAKAAATVSSTAPDEIKVNDYMAYDPNAKRVTLEINSALGGANGGMNFNGGARGDHTITIPVGWTVSWEFKNLDAIPHSAIIIDATQPFPALPQDPAIPRAYTAHVSDGLPTNGTDQTTFKTANAGQFALVCGVPGHAPSGMWIHFDVDASATKPDYAMQK